MKQKHNATSEESSKQQMPTEDLPIQPWISQNSKAIKRNRNSVEMKSKVRNKGNIYLNLIYYGLNTSKI